MSRSAAENAVALFSVGSRSSAVPRGNHSGSGGGSTFVACLVGILILPSPVRARSSCGLGLHPDGSARALGHTQSAPLAIVVVELETPARAELDHRVVRADAIAVVTFEAVAARQAAASFEERISLVKAADDFVERRLPAHHVEQRLHALRRVAVVPGIQLLKPPGLVFWRR